MGNSASLVNEGWTLFELGSVDKAVELWTHAANAGNAEAMYNLAQCYKDGRGRLLDEDKAAQWFKRAAEIGNVPAMVSLGYALQLGRGTPRNAARAFLWYSKAAKAGNPTAMYNVGICYRDGDGVTQDLRKARKWLTQAASRGHVTAMVAVAFAYAFGQGGERSPQKYVEWLHKAAEKGNLWAMNALGLCYRDGDGVSEDRLIAEQWFSRAAEAGSATAMVNFGHMRLDSNPSQALRMFRQAIAMGSLDAMVAVGVCYRDGLGLEANPSKANEWFEKAASGGHGGGHAALGRAHEFGLGGMPVDPAKALQSYQLSAELDSGEGLYELGRCYRDGACGAPLDLPRALDYLRKASEHRVAAAMVALGDIYESGGLEAAQPVEACAWYRRAAEIGDAAGMRALGLCYHRGVGVDADAAEALRWFRRAGDLGHSGALLSAGLLYLDGATGVPRSTPRAVQCFTMSAELGSPRAMGLLGVCLRDMIGVTEPSSAAAVEWFYKGAKAGDAESMVHFGRAFEGGDGLKRSLPKALDWYRRSALAGSAEGMRRLGLCFLHAIAVTASIPQARSWLKNGAHASDSVAMRLHALFILSDLGLSTLIVHTPSAVLQGSISKSLRGARRDHAESTATLVPSELESSRDAPLDGSGGHAVEDARSIGSSSSHARGGNGGAGRRVATRVPSLTRSQGSTGGPRISRKQATLLTNGAEFVPPAVESPKIAAVAGGASNSARAVSKALKWLRRAAKVGDATAMEWLGRCIFRGDGVPAPSEEKAFKYLARATELGSLSAPVTWGVLLARSGQASSAREKFEQAVARGSSDAHFELARIVDSPEEAIEHLRVAADAGHAQAMVSLASEYLEGVAIPRDAPAAIRYLLCAADAGNATALNMLGCCYRDGDGLDRQNDDLAVHYFRLAAVAGDVEAMVNLGFAYHSGRGVVLDRSTAAQWYRQASEKGSASGMLALFDVLFSSASLDAAGDAAAADAISWLERAAATDFGPAQIRLAEMLQIGEPEHHSLAPNAARALALYDRVAAGADADLATAAAAAAAALRAAGVVAAESVAANTGSSTGASFGADVESHADVDKHDSPAAVASSQGSTVAAAASPSLRRLKVEPVELLSAVGTTDSEATTHDLYDSQVARLVQRAETLLAELRGINPSQTTSEEFAEWEQAHVQPLLASRGSLEVLHDELLAESAQERARSPSPSSSSSAASGRSSLRRSTSVSARGVISLDHVDDALKLVQEAAARVRTSFSASGDGVHAHLVGASEIAAATAASAAVKMYADRPYVAQHAQRCAEVNEWVGASMLDIQKATVAEALDGITAELDFRIKTALPSVVALGDAIVSTLPDFEREIRAKESSMVEAVERLRRLLNATRARLFDDEARSKFAAEVAELTAQHQSRVDAILEWSSGLADALLQRESFMSVVDVRRALQSLDRTDEDFAAHAKTEIAAVKALGNQIVSARYATELSEWQSSDVDSIAARESVLDVNLVNLSEQVAQRREWLERQLVDQKKREQSIEHLEEMKVTYRARCSDWSDEVADVAKEVERMRTLADAPAEENVALALAQLEGSRARVAKMASDLRALRELSTEANALERVVNGSLVPAARGSGRARTGSVLSSGSDSSAPGSARERRGTLRGSSAAVSAAASGSSGGSSGGSALGGRPGPTMFTELYRELEQSLHRLQENFDSCATVVRQRDQLISEAAARRRADDDDRAAFERAAMDKVAQLRRAACDVPMFCGLLRDELTVLRSPDSLDEADRSAASLSRMRESLPHALAAQIEDLRDEVLTARYASEFSTWTLSESDRAEIDRSVAAARVDYMAAEAQITAAEERVADDKLRLAVVQAAERKFEAFAALRDRLLGWVDKNVARLDSRAAGAVESADDARLQLQLLAMLIREVDRVIAEKVSQLHSAALELRAVRYESALSQWQFDIGGRVEPALNEVDSRVAALKTSMSERQRVLEEAAQSLGDQPAESSGSSSTRSNKGKGRHDSSIDRKHAAAVEKLLAWIGQKESIVMDEDEPESVEEGEVQLQLLDVLDTEIAEVIQSRVAPMHQQVDMLASLGSPNTVAARMRQGEVEEKLEQLRLLSPTKKASVSYVIQRERFKDSVRARVALLLKLCDQGVRMFGQQQQHWSTAVPDWSLESFVPRASLASSVSAAVVSYSDLALRLDDGMADVIAYHDEIGQSVQSLRSEILGARFDESVFDGPAAELRQRPCKPWQFSDLGAVERPVAALDAAWRALQETFSAARRKVQDAVSAQQFVERCSSLDLRHEALCRELTEWIDSKIVSLQLLAAGSVESMETESLANSVELRRSSSSSVFDDLRTNRLLFDAYLNEKQRRLRFALAVIRKLGEEILHSRYDGHGQAWPWPRAELVAERDGALERKMAELEMAEQLVRHSFDGSKQSLTQSKESLRALMDVAIDLLRWLEAQSVRLASAEEDDEATWGLIAPRAEASDDHDEEAGGGVDDDMFLTGERDVLLRVRGIGDEYSRRTAVFEAALADARRSTDLPGLSILGEITKAREQLRVAAADLEARIAQARTRRDSLDAERQAYETEASALAAALQAAIVAVSDSLGDADGGVGSLDGQLGQLAELRARVDAAVARFDALVAEEADVGVPVELFPSKLSTQLGHLDHVLLEKRELLFSDDF